MKIEIKKANQVLPYYYTSYRSTECGKDDVSLINVYAISLGEHEAVARDKTIKH